MTQSDTHPSPSSIRGRKLSGAVLFLLAPILAYVAVLMMGTGWSPVVYLLGTAILAPIGGAWIAARARKPILLQLGWVLILVLTAGAVGYLTARPDPARLFERAFNMPVPVGVTPSQGRQQWFDGQTMVLTLHADDQSFATLLTGRPFERDVDFDRSIRDGNMDAAQQQLQGRFRLSSLVDPHWQQLIQFRSAQIYYCEPGPQADGRAESTTFLRNEVGNVWVVHSWGS